MFGLIPSHRALFFSLNFKPSLRAGAYKISCYCLLHFFLCYPPQRDGTLQSLTSYQNKTFFDNRQFSISC